MYLGGAGFHRFRKYSKKHFFLLLLKAPPLSGTLFSLFYSGSIDIDPEYRSIFLASEMTFFIGMYSLTTFFLGDFSDDLFIKEFFWTNFS